MNGNITDCISSRKTPKQGRSKALVSAILEAAIQVLTEGGIRSFTTARVAERAGISVGSLYQYFPNKASILFQLQINEWKKTQRLIQSILEDSEVPPLERLDTAISSFIHSECNESGIRKALVDASPFYRNTNEFSIGKANTRINVKPFIKELLPNSSSETLEFIEDLLLRVVTSFGKQFSEESRTEEEIKLYSTAISNMLAMKINSYK
jgi:AcrR family transcriptional regulator